MASARILLDKKGLCNGYSSVYPECSLVYKKKSDYRGNFIIGVSKKSLVNGLHSFKYKSSVYRVNSYRVGNVLRKKFGIMRYSV